MKPSQLSTYIVEMALKNPFRTSFGVTYKRKILLVRIIDENGVSGWGECVAEEGPWYSGETIDSCKHVIHNYLWPLIKNKELEHPSDFPVLSKKIRENNMAKSALEDALWDLYARLNEKSLAEIIGGEKESIPSGISIGIQDDINELLKKIEKGLERGYKRIKLKIAPGWDVEVLKKVRDQYPEIPLMVDANAAYRLKDKEILLQLDRFDLMMIEQPLMYYDIVDHAKLQKELSTPICLDESIKNVDIARAAIEIDACKIINVKPARVGGITETLKIHKLAKAIDIPLWCGGMLETGIGRAKNVAIASLETFVLPNDISESDRYYQNKIIEPIFVLEDGVIKVPRDNPGIGVTVKEEIISALSTEIINL